MRLCTVACEVCSQPQQAALCGFRGQRHHDRKAYPTDLTDSEWLLLETLLPPDSSRGHPRTVNQREVINSILYVLRGDIPWRMMRHELPPLGHGLVVFP